MEELSQLAEDNPLDVDLDLPNEPEEQPQPKKPKIKRKINTIKFDELKLINPQTGVKRIYLASKQFKQSKDSIQSLSKMISLVKNWHFSLMPKLEYGYFLERSQILGNKQAVKTYMNQLRKVHKGQLQFKDFEPESDQLQNSTLGTSVPLNKEINPTQDSSSNLGTYTQTQAFLSQHINREESISNTPISNLPPPLTPSTTYPILVGTTTSNAKNTQLNRTHQDQDAISNSSQSIGKSNKQLGTYGDDPFLDENAEYEDVQEEQYLEIMRQLKFESEQVTANKMSQGPFQPIIEESDSPKQNIGKKRNLDQLQISEDEIEFSYQSKRSKIDKSSTKEDHEEIFIPNPSQPITAAQPSSLLELDSSQDPFAKPE